MSQQFLAILTLMTFFIVGLGQARAQETDKSALKMDEQGPLMVNIDSPNFRKLSAAIPLFLVDQKNSKEADAFAKKGAEELANLLTFSGLFNIVSDAAYKDMLKTFEEQLKKDRAEKVLGEPAKKGLEGVDVQQWKALGVESLTLGEVVKDEDGLTLEIRTIDITRGQMLIGKRYRKINQSDYVHVLRRYADLILQAYTGKPGIFSTKVAFIGRKTKTSNKQVYVCDFDGSNLVQVTNENAIHVSVQWSPDGRFLTFTSYESGNPDLYRYELATGKKIKISGRQGLNSGGNWAPNNQLIAFTMSSAGDTDIFLTNPDGTGRKPFITGRGLDVDPAFSPDKKWLAFVSGRYGNPHIFVGTLKWNGEKDVRVVGDKRLTYAGWYNSTPSWSPNSEKIAFAGYDKDIDRYDVFMMNPDGSQLERLTLKTGDNEAPTWAPNGQLIMFQSNRIGQQNVKGRAHLFIMNRDGSNQRPINVGLYEEQTPQWSPPL